MKRDKLTRILSLLLALTLALPLAALPAHAGQFRDVADTQTSLAADVLSALGIVNGTEPGQFSPEGHLTRAQLCKMAVLVLGMGGKVEAQTYRTIFTDMGSTHWARGYVNLAATTEIPEGSGARLMLGLGNGTFGPDREISYQETATLALRILGYGEEANRAWPSGAIQTATRLGLDRDLNIQDPAGPITRGQTALLFYRLLSTPPKGGDKPFADGTLGTLVEDAIVLSTNATMNNQSGWVLTAKDGATTAYRPAAQVDSSLLGLRGSALLDSEGRFVTLLPDHSSYVSAPVTQMQAYYLYLAGRGRYTLSESTPVYTGSSHDSAVTTYKDYMAGLRVGDVVTLYLDGDGKVTGLFKAEASPETRFLVVRSSSVSAYTFLPITGGEQHYTIRKNGASISLSDIRQYDVVTYDPISKVLDVCDARLTCVYENASPSPQAPTTITAAGGNTFTVLADAMGDFTGRGLGDSITLLFTSNGLVAGALPVQYSWASSSSNALGVLTGDSFQMLGCSKTLHLNADSLALAQASGYQGALLHAYSSQRGVLSFQPAGSYIYTQFSPYSMTLGGMRVSPGVRIYERLAGGELKARSLSDLPGSVNVSQYHTDSSGQVDLIIIGSYSGDGVEYGRIDVLNGYRVEEIVPEVVPTPGPDNPGGDQEPQAPIYRRYSAQKVSYNGKEYPVAQGQYLYSGYAQLSLNDSGEALYANYLRAIPDVPSSAFYTQDGVTYVRTSQGVFQVDEGVQCYNIAASYSPPSYPPAWVNNSMWSGNEWQGYWPEGWEMEWFPDPPSIVKFADLSECRNFAPTLTIYVDSVGQRVRVVEVN